MRIEAVELRRVNLPLVEPFRTSFGTQHHRDILIVHVIGPDSEGWGECVALAEPLYSAEYVAGAQHVMREHLLPRLQTVSDIAAADVAETFRAVRGHPMAKAALEMAILDAELRAQDVSFGAFLGAVRTEVDCGVSVGIHPTVEELLSTVERHLAEGYRRIKLKVEPGYDIEPVRAVREHFGDIPLQVDGNAAYRVGDLHALAALDEFALVLIEQPFPEEDIAAHADLANLMSTPICLDESITSARVAEAAIALGACSVVNIKAGRVGGYLEARRVHDACAALDVPVWCGGMLETGLGRAANVALAGLPGFTLPGDTSASGRYYEEDLTEPFVLKDGRLAVPDGPGLGVTPLPKVLARVTTAVETCRFRADAAVAR
jgi:O-succinylbenzoate synthase